MNSWVCSNSARQSRFAEGVRLFVDFSWSIQVCTKVNFQEPNDPASWPPNLPLYLSIRSFLRPILISKCLKFLGCFSCQTHGQCCFFASRSCDAARFDQSWSKLKRIARDSRRVSMEVVADSLGTPSSIKSCNKGAPCDVHHATTFGPVFIFVHDCVNSYNWLCSIARLPRLHVTPASHKRCAKLSGLSGWICWAAASSNGVSNATRLSQAIWRAKPVAAKAKPWSLSFAVRCGLGSNLFLAILRVERFKCRNFWDDCKCLLETSSSFLCKNNRPGIIRGHLILLNVKHGYPNRITLWSCYTLYLKGQSTCAEDNFKVTHVISCMICYPPNSKQNAASRVYSVQCSKFFAA